MRFSEIKGEEAFKAMGAVVGCLREMFQDEELSKIASTQGKGWILDFFTISLERQSGTWMKMFLILNPGMTKEDVSVGSVIKFAYDFKNDPELMSLFFSQGDLMGQNSSGSPMENIEETEKT